MTADLTAMEKEVVDRKTSHQGPLSVLTKIIEEKTVRQGSFAVEVEKMKSDLAEAERTLCGRQGKEWASQQAGRCRILARERDDRQRLIPQAGVAIHDTIKLLDDEDSLELFKKPMPRPCN